MCKIKLGVPRIDQICLKWWLTGTHTVQLWENVKVDMKTWMEYFQCKEAKLILRCTLFVIHFILIFVWFLETFAKEKRLFDAAGHVAIEGHFKGRKCAKCVSIYINRMALIPVKFCYYVTSKYLGAESITLQDVRPKFRSYKDALRIENSRCLSF